MKKLIALFLCGVMLVGSAAAFTHEPLDADQVFSAELKEQIALEEAKTTPSAWAKNEVECAKYFGLVPDLSDDPGYTDQITREQFAELVVQLLRTVDPEVDSIFVTPIYDDCSNRSVTLASCLGVVNGVGNDRFAPKQTTDREQIATMVNRAIHYLEGVKSVDLTPAPANIEGFSDQGQVSDWAVEGMGTLASNGIMNGTSATTLSPKDSCTVEQSICLIYRVYQAIQSAS